MADNLLWLSGASIQKGAYSEIRDFLNIENVEDLALSLWTGSSNLTTLGTITTGVWNGSIIGPAYLGTGTRDGTNFLRDDGTYAKPSASLGSLSDVTISSITTGELLKWNGTAWINQTLAEAGIQPAGSYETSFSKNTAFNKNFGAIAGTVSEGNHTHSIYAPLASPALTGTPTSPTATAGTNTTQIATTAFVQTAVNAAAGGAIPWTLLNTNTTVAASDRVIVTAMVDITLPLSVSLGDEFTIHAEIDDVRVVSNGNTVTGLTPGNDILLRANETVYLVASATGQLEIV